jgi:hypothetical protein
MACRAGIPRGVERVVIPLLLRQESEHEFRSFDRAFDARAYRGEVMLVTTEICHVDRCPRCTRKTGCRSALGRRDMEIVPLSLREAQEFVQQHHRHNKPPHGCKFALGVRADGKLAGVASAGRPVARAYDDGRTLEANRTCTDGTMHANSMLYGAVWRTGRGMGYLRCITYTQGDESGASLRAAGYVRVKELKPRGDWIDSSVSHKHLREPAQQSFIDDERRRTGDVPRVLWRIGQPLPEESASPGTP